MTTLDSVPTTLPKGLLASARSDSTRGFAPTKNSNLRQAPASRDIPCLTNLALLPWDDVNKLPSLASVSLQARQIAGQHYRYFGFHFLAVLSFFEALMIGLAPMPLGFAHDTTTALVYQRACQYWLGHLLVRLIIITTGRVCVCYRLTHCCCGLRPILGCGRRCTAAVVRRAEESTRPPASPPFSAPPRELKTVAGYYGIHALPQVLRGCERLRASGCMMLRVAGTATASQLQMCPPKPSPTSRRSRTFCPRTWPPF